MVTYALFPLASADDMAASAWDDHRHDDDDDDDNDDDDERDDRAMIARVMMSISSVGKGGNICTLGDTLQLDKGKQ